MIHKIIFAAATANVAIAEIMNAI